MDSSMNWFERAKQIGLGQWTVVKVRQRSKCKERLPVMIGLTQAQAIKQQARFMAKRIDDITYEIELSEF